MSALTVPVSSPAQLWFDRHLPELTSRCGAIFCRLPRWDMEEAIAETLAAIYQYAQRAAPRGRLEAMTPFSAVVMFSRQYRSGRRFAGTSSTDVLSERTRLLGRVSVVSLDHMPAKSSARLGQDPVDVEIPEALGRLSEDGNPLENVRRKMDYPAILRSEKISRKARRVFQVCAQD